MRTCRRTHVRRAGCGLALGFFALALSPKVAAARTFSLPDASTRFDVELTSESCDADSCMEAMTVVLYRKGSKRKVRSFSEKSCVVPLTKQGVPYVSIAKLYEVDAAIIFDDFNFDGDEDFAIKRETGVGYSGFAYTVYLHNAVEKRLVKDTALSELAGPGTLGFFQVDTDRQRLVNFAKDGCCFHQTMEYAFVDGEVVLARTTTESNGEVSVENHPSVRHPRREERAVSPAPKGRRWHSSPIWRKSW